MWPGIDSHVKERSSPVNPGQAIARVSLDGKTLEPAWVPGLNNPTVRMNPADLCYCPEAGLAIVPTYIDGRIAAFRIE